MHADALFSKIIKPVFASLKKSFYVVRADHISTPGMIDSQIITHLIEAKLVIADLTTRNPNAFYELGVRHMANKPVIHLYKRGERIPADVSLFRAVEISYSNAVAVGNSRKELAKAIKATFLPGFAVETPVTQSKGFQRLHKAEQEPLQKQKVPTDRTARPPIVPGAINLIWKLRLGGVWRHVGRHPPAQLSAGSSLKA
jgi:hypothetical protein